MLTLRLAGVIQESIVDGCGIRFVIFAQGCTRRCPGCHNPQTHSLDGGYESNSEDLLKAIQRNPLLSGVTLSGGEPFLQAYKFSLLAKQIHAMGLDIITYTGFSAEELLAKQNKDFNALLMNTDVLIDGEFILKQKSLLNNFKGSSNQRFIDSKKTILENKIYEINDIFQFMSNLKYKKHT